MEKQKVMLVGINLSSSYEISDEIEELRNLCISCDMDVIEEVIQNAKFMNKKTYVGIGKLEEIKILVEELEIDALVFNDELSPAQINNIQNYIDVIIYDRPYVILEIFKRKASTKEAILQVEIASLQYSLPKLVGLRANLSRQRGGGGNVLHGRGGGETKLELDRRNIGKRISAIQKELEILSKERLIQRKKRSKSNIPIVCLVGYTNSGKSSTLNSLMDYSKHIKKEVFQKDMPFATLETSTRLIKLMNNHEFLLIDTIGFINKLPTHLIEAFKSTLEEIKEADLILHIVDASSVFYQNQITITNDILKQLGVKKIPMLYIFNKIDKVDEDFFIPPIYDEAITISATKKINLDQLTSAIETQLYADDSIATFLIPYNKGNIVNFLNEEALVKETKYLNNGTLITSQVSPIIRAKLAKYEVKI